MNLESSLRPDTLSVAATLCLVLAILHTFMAARFKAMAHVYSASSFRHSLFEFLGEVEIVFGLWAAFFIAFSIAHHSLQATESFVASLSFAEPLFVFAIMGICASRPVLIAAEVLLFRLADLIPFISQNERRFLSLLFFGPLLGSFITEPAAMTVTAIVLRDLFFDERMSHRFRYATLGLLFVNISIGGTLTPFAAPPVLMVARQWNWDLHFMLTHFAWKAALACFLNVIMVWLLFRTELRTVKSHATSSKNLPFWLIAVHLAFMVSVVGVHRSPVLTLGLFLFFLGFVTATKKYQDSVSLREGLLVAWFLSGLVILGHYQGWWLTPLLQNLGEFTLFVGAAGLTAFTDNAALTYLGSQVESITTAQQFFLVAGAVVGGGLTVIANAPNPAGYSILSPTFGRQGISHFQLFLAALLPTTVAFVVFWFL